MEKYQINKIHHIDALELYIQNSNNNKTQHCHSVEKARNHRKASHYLEWLVFVSL